MCHTRQTEPVSTLTIVIYDKMEESTQAPMNHAEVLLMRAYLCNDTKFICAGCLQYVTMTPVLLDSAPNFYRAPLQIWTT